MLKRCRTCRFWMGDPKKHLDNAECEAITAYSIKARLAYPDPYVTPLYTDADFGCVLWEKREPMPSS